jgi:predicted TIM-barrel fold metal-dependent hydrolase
MNVDDLIMVSVDDHVVEPPHLFEAHLPKKYQEVAPRIVRKESGADVWVFEGVEIPNIALNAVAGRAPEEYNFEPTSFDEIRPGTYDIDRRIDDMNANGVLGSLNFPSMTGFCGQLFMRSNDPTTSLRLLQGYNDWHIDEWCGTHPGRMIPLMIPPSWDPDAMAAEVRRCAAKGCHAVTFSENPEKLGLPSLHSDHWDPFWAACCDEGTIVTMHIGSSSQLIVTAADAPVDVMITLTPLNLCLASGDMIWSRFIKQFPELRIALAEGGIGWMPWFLERIDYVYDHHRAWTHQDFGDRKPSEVFKERFITCFIDDRAGLLQRELLNIDNMTWECDYPHSDSTWPRSPEMFMVSAEGLTDHEINKITHENAIRLFRFDPFAHRSKEQCTVGALRAEATHVDTSIVRSEHAAAVAPALSGSLAAAAGAQVGAQVTGGNG